MGEEVSATSVLTNVSTTDVSAASPGPYDIELSLYYIVVNIAYYAALGPIAIIGNFLSVLVNRRNLRKRRSIPDMLTGTLAAVDLLNVLAVHTPAVVSMVEGQWIGGSALCSYQYFMAWSCLKTSFFIILLLTVDRYLALVKPFYYRTKVSQRKMKIALCCLTVFSFVSTSTTIIWFSDAIALLPNWYLCMNTWGTPSQYYSYILVFYGLTFIVGVIVFNVCNTALVFTLIRHRKNAKREKLRVCSAAQDKRERRVAKIIEALSAIFMIFWLPYLVFIILNQSDTFYNEIAEDAAIRILFANTLLNPVIYGLFNRMYRMAYIYYFRMALYYALCCRINKPEAFRTRKPYPLHRPAQKTQSHQHRDKPQQHAEDKRQLTTDDLLVTNGLSNGVQLADKTDCSQLDLDHGGIVLEADVVNLGNLTDDATKPPVIFTVSASRDSTRLGNGGCGTVMADEPSRTIEEIGQTGEVSVHDNHSSQQVSPASLDLENYMTISQKEDIITGSTWM